MTKKIPLTQDKFTLVDDIDYKYLMQWKWCAQKKTNTYYVVRSLHKGEPGYIGRDHCKAIKMHRVILERKLGRKLKDEELCDHISGKGLDNRRDNLRATNTRMNAQNRHEERTSQYPGVSLEKDTGKYRAQIQVNKKIKGLGYFDTQEEAYEEYKEACEIVKSGDKKAIEELMLIRKPSSKYKGVSWHKGHQKWQGYFTLNYKLYYVGLFDDEYEAHLSVEKEKSLHMRGNK